MAAILPVVRSALEEQIDSIAAEWDGLADRVGAEPWHRPGWARAWWRAFGEGTLHVVSIRREGRLAAVAPIERRGLGWRGAANWHSPTFSVLADDDEARFELVERALDLRPAWLSLPYLDAAEGPACMDAAKRHRYLTISRQQFRSPYVPTAGTLDDLWKSGQGIKKRKSELGRRQRRLAERGDVEFAVSDGREGLDELLAEGFPVEGSGWKADQGTAIVSRPETLRFYTDVAHWAAERGYLRLFYVRLDGGIVAFRICLDDGTRLYVLKSGVDRAAKPFSVGVLTMYEAIKYCFDHGYESLELLGAEAQHKREWTNRTRERRLVQAFRPDPVGAAAYTAYAYGRPLAKRALALARR